MSEYVGYDLEQDQQEFDLNEQDTPGEIYGPKTKENTTEEEQP